VNRPSAANVKVELDWMTQASVDEYDDDTDDYEDQALLLEEDDEDDKDEEIFGPKLVQHTQAPGPPGQHLGEEPEQRVRHAKRGLKRERE